MADQIWLALIVAVPAIVTGAIAPLATVLITNRSRRKDKEQDWARQDAVAAQAREAARLLLDANERVAATTQVTNAKLDVIHTLVNSNMTAAMQAELDATVRELAMMGEVIELKRANGHEPSVNTLATFKATELRIGELKATLADRLKA